MAAPRATQFIALRNLARGGHRNVRQLHMTGPATYASPVLLANDPPTVNLPRDLAGLRAECKRRRIDASGNKQGLVASLNADHLTHSRAFTTAVEQSKRPSFSAQQQDAAHPVRQFNTSRALKAVNDSSTIDFTFLPDLDPDNSEAATALRVPILPDNFDPPKTGVHAPEIETVVMKPQISSMSADSVFLPLAEVSDDHAMSIDFHAMADRLVSMRAVGSAAAVIDEQAGMVRKIFGDMVDDVLGAKGKDAAVA